MAVNLTEKKPEQLPSIEGVQIYTAQAGIKKDHHTDLTLMVVNPECTVGAVFTQNQFCAAPVQIARRHLLNTKGVRALIINTGNANAGTGEKGKADALKICEAVATHLACESTQIMPFSTGVILEPLPVEKIIHAVTHFQPANWADAARAIMTTDTIPKAAHRSGLVGNYHTVKVTGISKGAGMICPNMATMLGFIATDAHISQPILQQLTEEIAAQTFNCITVDGDTSTNDSFVILATGRSGQNEIDNIADPRYEQVKQLLLEVALELAQAIVRDAEGASKFISIRVINAPARETARKIAYAIAHSPLVKTAFSASDPNLGRILAAIGYANADIEMQALKLYLNNVLVVEQGGRADTYTEEQGQAVMQQDEIEILIDLRIGKFDTTIYTCDLTKEYININANYRS